MPLSTIPIFFVFLVDVLLIRVGVDAAFLTVPAYSLFLSMRNHAPYERRELVRTACSIGLGEREANCPLFSFGDTSICS